MARKRTAGLHERGQTYEINDDCCFGIGRTGSYYVDQREIVIAKFSVDTPMYGISRSKKPKVSVADPVLTSTERYLALSSGLRLARELSAELRPGELHQGMLWPIVWGEQGDAYLFTPRPNGVSYFNVRGNPIRLSRAAAIIILSARWDEVLHLGPTPSAAERKALWDQANGEAATWIDYPRAAADIGKVLGGASLRCPLGEKSHFMQASTTSGHNLLLDTGACNHLIGIDAVGHLKEHIRDSANPLELDTATGKLDVNRCIDLWIQELNLELTAYILENNPGALSVGRLCIDNGFEFWWPAHSYTPVLQSSDGTKIFLRVDNYTPELRTTPQSDECAHDRAMPARASKSSKSDGKASSKTAGAEPSSSSTPPPKGAEEAGLFSEEWVQIPEDTEKTREASQTEVQALSLIHI